jgi:hypothetical protein
VPNSHRATMGVRSGTLVRLPLAPVAQRTEQSPSKREVTGSSPVRGTETAFQAMLEPLVWHASCEGGSMKNAPRDGHQNVLVGDSPQARLLAYRTSVCSRGRPKDWAEGFVKQG